MTIGSNQPLNSSAVSPSLYPQFLDWKRTPTTTDIKAAGTRIQDNSQTPPVIYETTGAGVWNEAGGAPATSTSLGTVYLATLGQVEAGGAPSTSYVAPANYVATALSAIVVGAGVPATTAQQGYVYLATNAQAAAGLLYY